MQGVGPQYSLAPEYFLQMVPAFCLVAMIVFVIAAAFYYAYREFIQ